MFCVNATIIYVGWFKRLRHCLCHSCLPRVLCQRHNQLCELIQKAATQCLSLVFASCSVSTPQSFMWADSKSCDTVSVTRVRRLFCVNATISYVSWFNKLRQSVSHSCSSHVLCQRHNPLCGLIQPAATQCLSLVFASCSVSTPQSAMWVDSNSCDTVSLTRVCLMFCVNATIRCVGCQQTRHEASLTLSSCRITLFTSAIINRRYRDYRLIKDTSDAGKQDTTSSGAYFFTSDFFVLYLINKTQSAVAQSV